MSSSEEELTTTMSVDTSTTEIQDIEKKSKKKSKKKEKKRNKESTKQDGEEEDTTIITPTTNVEKEKKKKEKKSKKDKKSKKSSKKDKKEKEELPSNNNVSDDVVVSSSPEETKTTAVEENENSETTTTAQNNDTSELIDDIDKDSSKNDDNGGDENNNVHTSDNDHTHDDTHDHGHGLDDDRKIFVSRIPETFNEESITRIFQKAFGEDCIDEIALSIKRDDEEDNNDFNHGGGGGDGGRRNNASSEETTTHRGFGFITMSSTEKRDEAISMGTIRGVAKETSKKKHTMYIRPIVRSPEGGEDEDKQNLNVCFLWSKYRCPYGDTCKFNHIGEGGCVVTNVEKDPAARMKKKKCFTFRTKGKCKLGDECPYSHDIEVKKNKHTSQDEKKDPKDKDCINWKTKGKCRKRDKCPYRHDESVREAFLAKKEIKQTKKRGRSDNPQPLSIRVFGLNYDTKEEDIREYFDHCGPIREITFPKYEDSGRSKGYCGVLFTSPKATQKATEMDGASLHGRWLSIQGGKMYLKQWEGREQERVEEMKKDKVVLGEFGQKVKKRRKHGFEED